MQARNQRALTLVSAKLVCRSEGKTPVQCTDVDVQNEHRIEPVNEVAEISRAAAEERPRVTAVREQGFDLLYIPNVVLVPPVDAVRSVRAGVEPFTGLWITQIGQFLVAVHDMVTAPPQLLGHSGFAGAGDAFDQVVFDAHFRPRSTVTLSGIYRGVSRLRYIIGNKHTCFRQAGRFPTRPRPSGLRLPVDGASALDIAGNQPRLKRSRFMTFDHAATKASTKAPCPSD